MNTVCHWYTERITTLMILRRISAEVGVEMPVFCVEGVNAVLKKQSAKEICVQELERGLQVWSSCWLCPPFPSVHHFEEDSCMSNIYLAWFCPLSFYLLQFLIIGIKDWLKITRRILLDVLLFCIYALAKWASVSESPFAVCRFISMYKRISIAGHCTVRSHL